MKKSTLQVAFALTFSVAAMSAQAATLNAGDTLSISTGVNAYDSNGNWTNVSSGSWFAMDTDGNHKIASTEKDPLSQGTTGIVIGVTTTAGASHASPITVGDTNVIDAPWQFFGNTGSDYNTVPITGSTTAGLNMSGWTITWAGIPAINLGGGAWQPNCSSVGMGCAGHTFTNGNAMFTWDGTYGHTYMLNYAATVPLGDPSGFGGVQYYLHLEGAVSAVPVPAAAWLLGSGLLGLLGIAKRAIPQC